MSAGARPEPIGSSFGHLEPARYSGTGTSHGTLACILILVPEPGSRPTFRSFAHPQLATPFQVLSATLRAPARTLRHVGRSNHQRQHSRSYSQLHDDSGSPLPCVRYPTSSLGGLSPTPKSNPTIERLKSTARECDKVADQQPELGH